MFRQQLEQPAAITTTLLRRRRAVKTPPLPHPSNQPQGEDGHLALGLDEYLAVEVFGDVEPDLKR